MATITASKAQTGVMPKGLRVGLVAVQCNYSLGAALSAGDVIQMIKVPAGATPVQVWLASGSGAAVCKVGDGISTGRYLAGYGASANAPMAPINTVYQPYTYSADDTIDIKVSVVSTGAASGGFVLTAIFSMDP